MDETVILAKLDSLSRCISRIRTKTPESAEALINDLDRQDIISINLERAVQTCVDIAAHILSDSNTPAPSTMADGIDLLCKQSIIPEDLANRLKKAVGFRNISVHTYQAIDWSIVYSIITKRLDDFSTFAHHITKILPPFNL
jgi:uncharacterized protein YutE (UPF0331/DUF86 family)